MPNTPASIKEGVTAISPNQSVTEEDIEDAKEMFSSVGSVAEIKENNIDIYRICFQNLIKFRDCPTSVYTDVHIKIYLCNKYCSFCQTL